MPERIITKTQKRLLALFNDIEDEDIRAIIADVLGVEAANRSAHNFPIRKVREIVDSVARKQESEEEN